MDLRPFQLLPPLCMGVHGMQRDPTLVLRESVTCPQDIRNNMEKTNETYFENSRGACRPCNTCTG